MQLRVSVKPELAGLTDGRERFAGREGIVERPPAGRLAQHPDDPLLPGEQFEHAYTVKFDDGDEAVFLAGELEGPTGGYVGGQFLTLAPEYRELSGPAFGGKDAGASTESASVKVVTE